MKKTAFLFPGQGSQAVGMGHELALTYPAAMQTFEEADELLGYSLSEVCWDGPEAVLNETENTQPALLTHSIAVLRAAQTEFPDFQPAAAAGHSLGEFSALVAANSISFSDALYAVRERGLAMKSAGELEPGGMAAVLGLDDEIVEEQCSIASAEADGGVWVANDNCPGQVVISGHDDALDVASELLKEAGARKFVRLAVSIAAHSPLMEAAQQRFNEALKTIQIQDPGIMVVGNVGAELLADREAVVADLQAQLTSRVRWTQSIRLMLSSGVDTFIEIGSGNVLTGLLRRIERGTNGMAIDGPETWAQL